MIDPEAPNPRDAELIEFMAWLVPKVWGIAVDGKDEDDDPVEGPGEIADDAESWVCLFRYHVRQLAESVPLVGGPFGGTVVQTQRGDPSPYYEIRAADQRHYYTLTRLHCGHYEYRYRDEARSEDTR